MPAVVSDKYRMLHLVPSGTDQLTWCEYVCGGKFTLLPRVTNSAPMMAITTWSYSFAASSAVGSSGERNEAAESSVVGTALRNALKLLPPLLGCTPKYCLDVGDGSSPWYCGKQYDTEYKMSQLQHMQ